MATGSPSREFTTEELDAMAAAELPAFGQPAPEPARGPAMGPVAQLEAGREYTTEELDVLEKANQPQEFTTEQLDMEAVRLFDDPNYAPTRDEYFELKATKERLKAEGKIPGNAELAAKAVGGLVVTALDAFNSAVFSPLETIARSPATLQTGIGRAAISAMQLGGWAKQAMEGAPKYRDEQTGEFYTFSDPDFLRQQMEQGKKLRPTTEEDLKDYEFENHLFNKGIEAEYQALGQQTAPTELLTRVLTGRNQQETPNIAQAGALEIVTDPTNIIPFGAGAKALGASRLGKVVSSQAASAVEKAAGGLVRANDALAERFANVVTSATGFTPRDIGTAGKVLNFGKNVGIGGGIAAGAGAIGAPPEVTAAIAGFYPAYTAGLGVLRKIETGAGTAKVILRESADATNGLDQAARAAVLANPSVPQVFKEVLERPSQFVSIESTPARLAANQALSPQMRALAGKLSNPAIVQAVRGSSALATGAVKGAAINAPFALLAANAGEDEQAAAMLGAGAAFGAAGAGVDRFAGLQRRRQQAAISDVSRMLVDVELAGGDVGKMMSTQTPSSLVKLAALQGTFRNALDFVPLNATDYNANVSAQGGAGSAGLFVQAPPGGRAKVYINLDAKRQGIEPHEFGHALLASGALDGQQKFAARAWVDKTYGLDGIKARAAEYASNIIRAKNSEAFPGGDFEITPATLAGEIDNLTQGGLARGDMDGLDWARDEIFAETFAKASETMDFAAIRRGAPAGGNFLTFAEGILGAQARALSASGVRIDPQTGAPLDKPADLFKENPLLATDQALLKQLGTYINNYRQWANNPTHEKPAGIKIAPSGRASDLANNPQVTFYDRGDGTRSNAFATQDPATGQAILRDQRDLNAEHKKVREQLKALGGSKLLEPGNPVLGPKKTSDGRVTIRGKVLPPQFDFLNGFMPHIRNFARQFERFSETGESMQVRYHAIGSGDTGAFQVKKLGNLEAITREVLPFEWQLTKAGNLNAVVLDLTQFRNRALRAINGRNDALSPFNWEIAQVEADLKVWMDNHRNNLPGENKIGTAKRDAINALVGLATNQNRGKNPLNGAFGPGSAIKQFRLDRVDAAIGTGRQGFHFDYDRANGNLLPNIPAALPDLSQDLPGQAMPDVKMPDGRILDNWSKVKDGDNWNTVKRFLPSEDIDAPALPIGRSKDEVVESAARFLSEVKSAEDRKGVRVLLANPQTRGGYTDKLKNRAEHAIGRELKKGSSIRELDPDKAAWMAAVPETIQNAPVKVHTGSEVLYFRKYRKKTHMVVTSKEGVFLDQEPFDSGFVTQYPLELRNRQFKGAAKVEILPPPAALSGSPTNAATNATPATTDAVVQAGSVGTPGNSKLSSVSPKSRSQGQAMPDAAQKWNAPLYEPLPKGKTTLRLHHGTWRGGYEKFADGTHFSRSKEYASRYMHPSASSMGISGLKEAKIQEVISVDVTFDNLFDTRNAADRKIFEREFYRKYGTGTPIGERGLPDWTDAVDLAEFLEENHSQYDGIVVDEGAEPLENGEVRIRPEGFVPLKNAKIQIVDRTPLK